LKQITAIGGQNFVFNIHQAKYRLMLHKAVEIHFEMNYKRLCSSEIANDNDKVKNEEMQLTDEN